MSLSSALSLAKVIPWGCDVERDVFYCDYDAYHPDHAPELFSSFPIAALIAHGEPAAKAVEGVERRAHDSLRLVIIAHIVRRADEQASIPRFGALDGADDDGDAGNVRIVNRHQRKLAIQRKGALQSADGGLSHGAPLLVGGIGTGRFAEVLCVLAHQAHLVDAPV